MKKLILSNAHYLRDIDAILESIFNGTNLAKQPRYLIEIGCRDGFALRHSYNFIKSQTNRGKRLNDHPLEVVVLTLDESANASVQKELSGIPHQIAPISDKKSETILNALDQLGIEDTRLALYLELFSEEVAIDFQDYAKLVSHYGFIQLQAHSLESVAIDQYRTEIEDRIPAKPLSQKAENYLLDAAKYGWFPRTGSCYYYPKSRPYTLTTLNHFEHRLYNIREATEKDLPALSKIEEACWQKPFRKLKTRFAQRIKDYPEGQLVLESPEGVIGSAFSQRLPNIESLSNAKADSLHLLGDPKGPIVHLIALNVLPEKHTADLEDQFLEFFLQKSLVASNVTHVASVLRCQNYPGADVISMVSYVEELKQEKGSADLSTRLHVQHGGEIKKCIPDYRPLDEKNLGNGVLVVYSRESRVPAITVASKAAAISFEEEFTPESIEAAVDQMIHRLLAQRTGKAEKYSRSSNLMDMGLESIQLLELRALFTDEFSMDLPPNFFIQYETPEAIINFFIEAKLQPFREWLYEIDWQTTPKQEVGFLSPDRTWIIFADEGEEYASSLRGFLHEHRQKCVTVQAGKNFHKLNQETFVVDPSSAEDFEKLFSNIPDLRNLEGVVYLWGAKEGVNETIDPSLDDLENFHLSSLEALVILANRLASLKLETSPKLWVVTQSIAKDGSVQSLIEWPLNALCKIIREEYPKFQCCYVAVDPQESLAESCETLFEEIRSSSSEPQIAFRKGDRMVPRMVRSEVEAVRIPKFSPKASFLVAGGFRPLGILLARWYVSHGAKHLILLDEIEMTHEIKVVMDELKRMGIDIVTFKINLDNEAALKNALDQIERELPPLKGVIHAVGLVDNDLLMRMDWDRFKTVHRLKVSLSWNLHRLTQLFDLDHFILFSSCLPDLTPLGKANHATSNSFVDVLSHYRRKRGLPSLTIDWGPWELRHMEVRRLVEKSLSDRVKMLRIEEGLQVLDHLFYIPKAQITAVVVNWTVLLHSMAEVNPLFDEIAIELGFKRVDLLKNYMKASPEGRLNLIQSYLHERVRRILKLKSSHLIESARDFKKVGLDTSKMTKLKNQIQFDLEEALKLPFNFVEEHASLDKLSQALAEALDEVIKAQPISQLKEPIAMIGMKENEVALEILNDKIAQVKMDDLSKELLKELDGTLKSKGKPSIIIVDKNKE